MGSSDSGPRRTRADIVENLPVINVNALWHDGKLAAGYLGRVAWYWPDGQIGWVGVATDPKQVVFSFEVMHSEERVYVCVALIWKACYRGGQRPYLRCPTCDATFSKLYWLGTRICCRRCGRLGYATQRLNKADRALKKLNALRVRAGLEPLPDGWHDHEGVERAVARPRRRWRRTHERQQQRLSEAERVARREFRNLLERVLRRLG